jgi:hypothetical protein
MLKSLKTSDVKICRRAGKIEGFYIVKEKLLKQSVSNTKRANPSQDYPLHLA